MPQDPSASLNSMEISHCSIYQYTGTILKADNDVLLKEL